MKTLKNYGLDLCHVTMAAWSRSPEIHVCDIMTSQILAGPVKMIAKHDEHENIEKKVDIFHNSVNGILALTRNLIF